MSLPAGEIVVFTHVRIDRPGGVVQIVPFEDYLVMTDEELKGTVARLLHRVEAEVELAKKARGAS